MSETTSLAMPSNPISQPSVFDPSIFQQLVAISSQMAHTSLIPESLTKDKSGVFPIEKIQANCFLVAEQAHRWGMSPFAVAQAASVVYGRLMWEGKLVAAVIEANAGVRLSYTYEGAGLQRKVIVSGKFPNETEVRTVEGTVADWKTDQWKDSAYDQRLAYRGAREWARRHCPAVMLGVVTTDEADDFAMRDVTPLSVKTAVTSSPEPAAAVTPEVLPESAEKPKASKPTLAPAHVVSAEKELDGYKIVLRGTRGEHTVFADLEKGTAAEFLVGGQALVSVIRKSGVYILTDIKPMEGGDA